MKLRVRPGPVEVPADRRERNPLITPAAYARLSAIIEHPDAPRWNYTVGDRVVAEDLVCVEGMRELLRSGGAERAHGLWREGRPPDAVLAWVDSMRPRVPAFVRRLEGIDPARDWARVPTMTREDIAARIEEVVPLDADLERMIVYDTSGTTGHAIRVPHHPRAMALNHPLMEHVLERHGVTLAFGPERAACVNIGAQRDTVVFATVFAAWGLAPFAKVNFHARVWEPARARRFLAELEPQFMTGDPVGFAEMARWEIAPGPAALLSTAVELAPAWQRELAARYGCPVIDTYATTETGPIAYSAPDGDGMCILPPDVYVEVVDERGSPAREGEEGEICVTGGRNPYVPLLRYRTGDRAALARRGGERRLVDLRARAAVLFRAADGTPLNPVDVGRVIRRWAIVQHEFRQRADLSCELVVREAPGLPVDLDAIRDALREVFGPVPRIDVRADASLGRAGKVVAFASEIGA